MPDCESCQRRLRPWGLISRVGSLLVLAVLAGTGCRAFRCQKASDEAVASARQLALQAMAAKDHGQSEQAEGLFADAVRQCPADERARCGYAESLWHRGACDSAVAHMEEGVKLSGYDPERRVQLGTMYLNQGQLDAAAEQAARAIKSNAQLASAWSLQAKVQQAQGSNSEALANFHRALTLQPHFPEVQLALADIYEQQGRSQRCLATLQSLADGYPPDQVPVDVLTRQGLVLREMGRHQDATRVLAQAVDQGNPTAELLYQLAQAQLLSGDTASATRAVIAALERDPLHAGCRTLSDQLAIRTGTVAAVARP
jgi:tetratricopeptide (TPR) repeat protein